VMAAAAMGEAVVETAAAAISGVRCPELDSF